jgi:hypothetical protein
MDINIIQRLLLDLIGDLVIYSAGAITLVGFIQANYKFGIINKYRMWILDRKIDKAYKIKSENDEIKKLGIQLSKLKLYSKDFNSQLTAINELYVLAKDDTYDTMSFEILVDRCGKHPQLDSDIRAHLIKRIKEI